jgi:hypothetical protein
MRLAAAVPGLLALLLAVGIPSAAAQSVPSLPPDLEDTTNDVVGTVRGAAEDPVATTNDAVGKAADAVGGATGGSGSPSGSGGSSGGGTGAGSLIDSSVVDGSQPQSQPESGSQSPAAGDGARSGTGSGKAGGKAGSGNAGGNAGGGRSRGGTGGASSSYEPAFIPGELAASPVSVVKTNDADRDGTFTQRETAPEPDADVPFRIAVRNTGSGPVTILGLAHYLPDPSSSRVEVCPNMAGTTVEAGGSAVCAFTLRGYSPPRGSVKVSTAAANVLVDSGAKGQGTVTSLYATSTVETDAVDVSRLGSPGGFLAQSGVWITQLLLATFLLAGLGAELLRRGRGLGSTAPQWPRRESSRVAV